MGDINILSNDFSAEYAGIANIRVTTKRGGAGYHGSLFYNNKNSALAAWTLQDLIGKAEFAPTPIQSTYPNPYFNVTDLGGSIGGPIPGLKKTWFFAAYERDWTVAPVSVTSNTLPHPSMWTGDFSQVDDSIKPPVPADVTANSGRDRDQYGRRLGRTIYNDSLEAPQPDRSAVHWYVFPEDWLAALIDSSTGRIPPIRAICRAGRFRIWEPCGLITSSVIKTAFLSPTTWPHQTTANSLVQAPYSGLGSNKTIAGTTLFRSPTRAYLTRTS